MCNLLHRVVPNVSQDRLVPEIDRPGPVSALNDDTPRAVDRTLKRRAHELSDDGLVTRIRVHFATRTPFVSIRLEQATNELRVLWQLTEAGQSACVHLVERLLLSGQHDFARLEFRTRDTLNPFPVRLGARARLRFREGLRFLRADLGEYPFPLRPCRIKDLRGFRCASLEDDLDDALEAHAGRLALRCFRTEGRR